MFTKSQGITGLQCQEYLSSQAGCPKTSSFLQVQVLHHGCRCAQVKVDQGLLTNGLLLHIRAARGWSQREINVVDWTLNNIF